MGRQPEAAGHAEEEGPQGGRPARPLHEENRGEVLCEIAKGR